MFGSRNKVSLEEYQKVRNELKDCKKIISDLSDKNQLWEEKTAGIEESQKQMNEEMKQLIHNLNVSLDYTKSNVATEETLFEMVKGCYENSIQAERDAKELEDAITNQQKAWLELMDQNKHFTGPAKYLNELPSKLERQSQVYQETVSQMADMGKQMSVISLKSALEAAKLGEDGEQFLQSAEEVRNLANLYDRAAEGLLDELKQSREQISEMSEQIHYLISLLKENNIETGKMLKMCDSHMQMAQKTASYQLSKELEEMKVQLNGVYNLEQEFAKSEERDVLQLSDLLEELNGQKKDTDELIKEIAPLMSNIKGYK